MMKGIIDSLYWATILFLVLPVPLPLHTHCASMNTISLPGANVTLNSRNTLFTAVPAVPLFPM
jgi:hypothetical protein